MTNSEQSLSGEPQLKKTLTPLTLWGLGVGYVIAGEYFGWNIGLAKGGTFGMLIAFALVTTMYITFVFSYTELACAIPRAGGVFVYAGRALGPAWGYLGGIAQSVEFVFATPAIAAAIGGYLVRWFPDIPPTTFAIGAYLIFTALNIWGVQQTAIFELVVTVLAVAALLLFACVAAPHFEFANLTANAWPNGWSGALAAIPFAIWFFLAIEAVANAAEEARNPGRDVKIGFGAAITTLVLLACIVLFLSVGIGGWERVVFEESDITQQASGALTIDPAAQPSDAPLPLALGQIMAPTNIISRVIVGVGLLGFIASFNGIILAAGRSLFEMGRVGFLPRATGHVHPATNTPVIALLINMAIGIVAICFLDTAGLITMSAFGAVTLYIISMVALLRLRKLEPDLERPYKTPFYPLFPLAALIIAVFCFVTMLYYNYDVAEGPITSYSVWYVGFIVASFGYYFVVVKPGLTKHDLSQFKRLS